MSRLSSSVTAIVILAAVGCGTAKPPEAEATSCQPKAWPIASNAKHLDAAETYLAKFDTENDAEGPGRARLELEHVHFQEERDPVTRAQVRIRSLSLWLHLLAIVDSFLDPAFKSPAHQTWDVFPPRNADGVQLGRNADPALIDDPVARAKYADALAAKQEEYKRYKLQYELRALNDRQPPLPVAVEAWIQSAYSSEPRDQAELRTAIDEIITDPARKTALLKHLSP